MKGVGAKNIIIYLLLFIVMVYWLPFQNQNILKEDKKMNFKNKILLNKNGRKSASGITLIALIITIIVLLILSRSNYCGYNWK